MECGEHGGDALGELWSCALWAPPRRLSLLSLSYSPGHSENSQYLVKNPLFLVKCANWFPFLELENSDGHSTQTHVHIYTHTYIHTPLFCKAGAMLRYRGPWGLPVYMATLPSMFHSHRPQSWLICPLATAPLT